MNELPYWGVVEIPFLKIGHFTIEKRNQALEWCDLNCENKRITSDIRPWVFLSERDARMFADTFGGNVVFKEEAVSTMMGVWAEMEESFGVKK